VIPAGAEGVVTCACGHRIVRWSDRPGETARAEEFERELDAHAEAHHLEALASA
jgi:hypothetical protein